MSYPGSYEFVYDGPVMLFDRCVAYRWTERTFAPSEQKARSNLAYRYKKQCGLSSNAKVILPGKIQRCG